MNTFVDAWMFLRWIDGNVNAFVENSGESEI